MVTAILVNYLDHQLTARAVASVLADQPDAQVIVVDNSESPAEARALQSALPLQVEFIVAPRNLGFGNACNLGWRRARHEWIFLLNPDAFVIEGCIAALVHFLEQTPKAGAVAPLACWNRDQTWFLPPGQLPTPCNEFVMGLSLRWPWLGEKISKRFRKWALFCLSREHAIKQRMLSGGHMLLRHSALKMAGGLFDPGYFMYFEDTDLCQRLHRCGFNLYLLPMARVVHEWRCTPEKSALCENSHQYYRDKHYPRHWLLKAATCLGQSKLSIRLPKHQGLGRCQKPPVLYLPPEFPAEWLLELSPHPLLVPALYHFGNGNRVQICREVWDRLGPGQYMARVAPLKGSPSNYFSWEIG